MFMLKSTHQQEVYDLQMDLAKARVNLIDANMEIIELKSAIVDMKNHLYEMYKKVDSQKAQQKTFTDEELRKLVQLCHPDRHNGSKTSVEMTQLINKLREKN